jgi:septum formation topological specificity factor MinE
MTMSTLRVSLVKKARHVFSVLTQHPRTKEWFEQVAAVGYDPELGHPNPTDEELLVGLMKWTCKKGYTHRQIRVERTGLLELLKKRTWTQSKDRLEIALKRWSKVTLAFEQGHFDEVSNSWVAEVVSVFTQMDIKPGNIQIEWSEPVFKSLRDGLADFYLQAYHLFQNPTARRIYLFTYHALAGQGMVDFPLREFVEKTLHLAIGYKVCKIQEKLARGLTELEQKGYIKPAATDGRFPYKEGDPLLHLDAGPMFARKAPKPKVNNPSQMELEMDKPFMFGPLRTLPTNGKTAPVVLSGPPQLSGLPDGIPSPGTMRDASEHAILAFWERLPFERRQEEEKLALVLATERQKELLQQNASNIRKEILRDHVLRLLFAQAA